MTNFKEIAERFYKAFGLNYSIVGHNYINEKPEQSIAFKEGKGGCITGLIFSAARGKVVAVNKNTAGWNCAAYYSGYRNDIFSGIEYFLSCGPEELVGREPERFFADPQTAKEMVDYFKPEVPETRIGVFKPLEMFSENDQPEIAIIFTDPDRISGFIYLANFKNPLTFDKIVTGTISSCASLVHIPLKFARSGIDKIVLGHTDPSARLRLPKYLMALAMPIKVLEYMNNSLDECFVKTSQWQEILKRADN